MEWVWVIIWSKTTQNRDFWPFQFFLSVGWLSHKGGHKGKKVIFFVRNRFFFIFGQKIKNKFFRYFRREKWRKWRNFGQKRPILDSFWQNLAIFEFFRGNHYAFTHWTIENKLKNEKL